MNNQFRDLYSAVQSGNIGQIFQQMAMSNPQMKPVLQMMNSGVTPRQIFYDICQQRGINPDEFIKNITG